MSGSRDGSKRAAKTLATKTVWVLRNAVDHLTVEHGHGVVEDRRSGFQNAPALRREAQIAADAALAGEHPRFRHMFGRQLVHGEAARECDQIVGAGVAIDADEKARRIAIETEQIAVNVRPRLAPSCAAPTTHTAPGSWRIPALKSSLGQQVVCSTATTSSGSTAAVDFSPRATSFFLDIAPRSRADDESDRGLFGRHRVGLYRLQARHHL